ncbi:hypothetical protein [Bacteriophage Eos]|nr:hypothetical protein [Bacteriophage Eos]
MTNSDIELLMLIHLKGPQNVEQIQKFRTTPVLEAGYVYWMPTDRGRVALTLTDKGGKWVKEAIRIVWENSDCLVS